jgi:type IX secretion system PorP/SprF family membrane protein
MKKTILLSMLCLAFQAVFSQDNTFSLHTTPGLMINPANTGCSGDQRLSLYSGMNYLGYKNLPDEHNIHFAAEKTILKGKLGIGGFITHDFGKDMVLRGNSAMISTAFNQLLFHEKYKLSTGLQAGIVHNSCDWDQLFYNDAGLGIYPEDTMGEPKNNIFYPDVNVGALLQRDVAGSILNPWLSVSLSHIFKPDHSFLSDGSRLPMKLLVHTGIDLTINENIKLSPMFCYFVQADFKNIQSGIIAKYEEDQFRFSIGTIYQDDKYDLYDNRQISVLGSIGYAGLEFRMELMVTTLNNIRITGYSRGFAELSWTLPERKHLE